MTEKKKTLPYFKIFRLDRQKLKYFELNLKNFLKNS